MNYHLKYFRVTIRMDLHMQSYLKSKQFSSRAQNTLDNPQRSTGKHVVSQQQLT